MRVELTRTYTGHRGPVSAIEVREPTGALLMVHGEPWEVAQTPQGGAVIIENREAIKGYLEACCEPGVDVLAQLGVEDFRRVRNALRGFFTVAPASPTLSTNSSSATGEDGTKSGG